MMNQVQKKAMIAVIEGLVLSTVIVFVMFMLLPDEVFERNPSEIYARRYGGGCSGWTTTMACLDIAQNLGLWYCYCTIAVVLNQSHPLPLKEEPMALLTLRLIVAFIVGCGFKHLVDAYTDLHPVYPTSICVGFGVGIVSAAALWTIACALETAKDRIQKTRDMIQQLRDEDGKTVGSD